MRHTTAFAAMAIAIVANGCDLVGPEKREVFTLVRVNGQPVPYTISRSPNYLDPNIITEVRWARGTIVLFAGGRLDWELISDRLVNGLPHDDLPPHRDHVLGAYARDGETLQFGRIEGTFLDGGRTLSMKDREGRRDFFTFEFERTGR
jgi:hypothetical protein